MDGSAVQSRARDNASQKPWPAGGLTRVPYRVFQKDETYEREQERIFQGPLWQGRGRHARNLSHAGS
jgi:hypothetical protein